MFNLSNKWKLIAIAFVGIFMMAACQPPAPVNPPAEEPAEEAPIESIESVEEPYEQRQELEYKTRTGIPIKTNTSDKNGVVEFTDSTTGELVTVELLDQKSEQPVDSLNVTFFDGQGFEVFIVTDSLGRYKPALEAYEHNSTHIIKVEELEGGEKYEVEKRSYWVFGQEDDGYYIIQRWIDEQDLVTERTYRETISEDEHDEIMDLEGKLIDLGKIIVTILVHSGGTLTIEPLEGGIWVENESGPQWDVFHEEWDLGENSGLRNGSWLYLPSNPPTIEDLDLSVENSSATATWKARDEYTYSDGKEDPTIFLGRTNESDLDYHYRVVDNEGNTIIDWTTTTEISISLPGLEDNKYVFEVYATDEVNNQSGLVDRVFTVGDPPTDPSSDGLTDSNQEVLNLQEGAALLTLEDLNKPDNGFINFPTGPFTLEGDFFKTTGFERIFKMNDFTNLFYEFWSVPPEFASELDAFSADELYERAIDSYGGCANPIDEEFGDKSIYCNPDHAFGWLVFQKGVHVVNLNTDDLSTINLSGIAKLIEDRIP